LIEQNESKMAFELKQGEKVPKGVRRILSRRIDKALKTLESTGKAISDPAVHDARKRFKEIRGTLRLVRREMGDTAFERENKTFRDAGRRLSKLRDAKVLVDSLDQLVGEFGRRMKVKSLLQLRRALVKRRREMREKLAGRDKTVSGIVRKVEGARKRLKKWPLKRGGWKAIGPGLKQVYEQGRRAMEEAREKPSDEDLHEWRKRAKDLRYELELLKRNWPQIIEPLAEHAHKLTDLLGDDHDLVVLSTVAREQFGEKDSVETQLLFALIDERRKTLQREAFSMGGKLYQDKPDAFVRRIKGYWKKAQKPPRRPKQSPLKAKTHSKSPTPSRTRRKPT
jgi:CHAD domain-containing protein